MRAISKLPSMIVFLSMLNVPNRYLVNIDFNGNCFNCGRVMSIVFVET